MVKIIEKNSFKTKYIESGKIELFKSIFYLIFEITKFFRRQGVLRNIYLTNRGT